MTVENTNIAETINITTNGQYDVARYTTANVNTPAAPDYYISKSKDANNKLVGGSTIINLNGITDVGDYALAYAYYGNSDITGTIDLSSLTSVTGSYAFMETFDRCYGITGIDLSNLTSVSGRSTFQGTFYYCTGLTGTINLGNLETVTGPQAFNIAFQWSGITGVNLSKLKGLVNVSSVFQNAFSNCASLTGIIDLSSVDVIYNSSQCFASAFFNDKNITKIDLSGLFVIGESNYALQSLNNVSGSGNTSSLELVDLSNLVSIYNSNSALQSIYANSAAVITATFPKLAKIYINNTVFNYTFSGCTNLTTVSFPNLCYSSDLNSTQFNNMLSGCTGVTVHFPAELESLMQNWTSVTNGFGGTNTTVLFDLPSITTLDLTNIIEIKHDSAFQNSFSRLPNITSVDFSNLTIISGNSTCVNMFLDNTGTTSVDLSSLITIKGNNTCNNMFKNNTSLTTLNLSSLTTIDSFTACQNMLSGCTSLTSLSFPALKTVGGYYVFSNMLSGVTGCTVHFPSNLSSYNFNCGGTNTTVLYDLPATA